MTEPWLQGSSDDSRVHFGVLSSAARSAFPL